MDVTGEEEKGEIMLVYKEMRLLYKEMLLLYKEIMLLYGIYIELSLIHACGCGE